LIAGGNAGDIVSGSIFGMMGAGIGLGVGTSVASTAMMGKVSSKFWKAAIPAGTGGFAGGFSMTTMSGLAAGRSLGESLQQGVTVGGITALGAGIFAGMSAKYAKPTKPLDNDGTGIPDGGTGEFPEGNVRGAKGDFKYNNSSGEIKFGETANQKYHTFRHINKVGLNQVQVESNIRLDLSLNSTKIQYGQPFNQSIFVDGTRITYTAFRLQNGNINVGRITVP
jgi:hypothetical protein